MIKCVLFDLDGVLLDSREMHYETLNKALEEVSPEHVIGLEEHLTTFNGLPTKEKLRILSKTKGLSSQLHPEIFALKQDMTLEWIRNKVRPDNDLVLAFQDLYVNEYSIGVVSNSVRNTTDEFLKAADLERFVSVVISNQDAQRNKPNPEMYLRAMARLGVSPDETLIVEDSPVGCKAAKGSVAHVLHVSCPQELTRDLLFKAIRNASSRKQKLLVPNLNVVVPMAGQGSRFQQAGYRLPKPLIDVNGRPMIQVVVDSLGLEANFTFLVRTEHEESYAVSSVLNVIQPNHSVVPIRELTEGAACTVLLAKDIIDNDDPMMIVNSDQDVKWDYAAFMQKMHLMNADAGILTFRDNQTKWSFAKIDDAGYVTEVAEKRPISDIATCGIYYWRRGSDFVRAAQQMIRKNVRVNNEFYVCPVFNEAIEMGLKIITFDVETMEGLGTPEDLTTYLERRR